MTLNARPFKFSGRIAPQDALHQITHLSAGNAAPDEHYLAPTTVTVKITNPSPQTIGAPQYAPTVNGGSVGGYNPAQDCNGNFMSYKFQPNNNCYAYGCNISTNTFPQPGRASGNLITTLNGPLISQFAEADGLQFVGTSMSELLAFKQRRQGTTPPQGEVGTGNLGGHFVALMISPAGDANWPGDYHWARCDNSSGACDSWSQKDGSDQVTNFDFAGNAITDPSTANWTVNQGPVSSSQSSDLVVDYAFYCFMFVPDAGVNII